MNICLFIGDMNILGRLSQCDCYQENAKQSEQIGVFIIKYLGPPRGFVPSHFPKFW